MAKPRIIYIHGNGSMHWSGSWAAWLKNELDYRGYPTYFETMPDSIIARSEYWLPYLKEYAKAGNTDVLLGWSSGAVAAMRYAEEERVLGSILISPSCTDLDDPIERQSGYFATPWRWSAIAAHQKRIALLWGDNDPYIPQDQFLAIAENLHPEQIIVPGGKHFIEQETFPEVLEYIVRSY